MSISDPLQPLVSKDGLRELAGFEKPVFIHNDHRWVLPVLAWAQIAGLIQRPSLLVMFDYHTDFAKPFLRECSEGMNLAKNFNCHPSVESAIQVCSEHLDHMDGDWVSGGMELGIIGDAIVLGAEVGEGADCHKGKIYTDLLAREHKFWSLPLPLDALAYQGVLADHYHKPSGLWESLHWTPSARIGEVENSIALNFDLDLFAIHSNLGPSFPWPEKIFKHQLQQASMAPSLDGLTGYQFMRQLIEKSSIITIAREPAYCGGEEDCNAIFDSVNKFIFDGRAAVS